jgi:hypothetical protein
MKSREMIGIVIALVIISVSGILLYSQLAPVPKESGVQVVIPQAVAVPLKSTAEQDKLTDIKRLTDYSVPQRCIDNPDACNRNGEAPI